MAVRVVKTEPDPEVVKRVICRHCGATLEYVPNDVKKRDGRDMGGGGADGWEWVDCPSCNKQAIIRSW